MGNQDKGHSQGGWLNGIAGERLEIVLYETGITLQLSYRRGTQIMETPACHHSIKAQDNG